MRTSRSGCSRRPIRPSQPSRAARRGRVGVAVAKVPRTCYLTKLNVTQFPLEQFFTERPSRHISIVRGVMLPSIEQAEAADDGAVMDAVWGPEVVQEGDPSMLPSIEQAEDADES